MMRILFVNICTYRMFQEESAILWLIYIDQSCTVMAVMM